MFGKSTISFYFIGKLILPGFASLAVLIAQGPQSAAYAAQQDYVVESVYKGSANYRASPTNQRSAYLFGNPAGCPASSSIGSDTGEMMENVQRQLGGSIDLASTRQDYIWNGPLNTMINVTHEPFVLEFVVDDWQPPFTYKADEVATIFLNHGFVVWFRSYGGHFRLMAVPVMDGVYDSAWGEYIRAYWQGDDIPTDEYILPVTKKLPCHWMIDDGWVTEEQLRQTFNFDWHMPEYLTAGRQYLASDCEEANRISREELGFWDAASVCGPLTWQIIKDSNSFPYRIGNWYSNARLFIHANPRLNGRPWLGFDPDTFDLISIETPMMGHDFASNGNLYPGDILYSYSTEYMMKDGRFDHIFMVAGLDAEGSRLSISNMVQNAPHADCFIREVALYTPGDLETGVIHSEWNDHGFGSTGTTGFDIFRWKWVTYHVEGKPVQYTVRWGDTIETIAFDWKISPQSILDANRFEADIQLEPGQVIRLPAPSGL